VNWPTVPIGELVAIRGGGTPQRSNEGFFRGDIPWVTPKDMKTWEIDDAQIKITREAIEQSAANEIPKNTVLLVVRSGVLKHTAPVAINRRPIAINQDMKSLQCNGRLLPEYLARFLKSAEPIILSWVRATTADNYSIDNIRELPIPLPPLDEQRRIAAILDQADDLRRKRRGALQRLEALLQADFIYAFCIDPKEDWPEVSVSDVTKSIRTGPFGSQLLHSEFTESGIAVLGIDNAVNNEFRWDERRSISEAKYRELQRYRVFPRDLLITIMGTCGRAAIVPDDIPLAINTKHLCCLTLDESRCLPEFLHACFLRHPSVLHQLGVRERGAIMGDLNMGLIKETKLPLPPLDLQRAFAARVAEIDKLKAHHRAHLAKLDTLFASLQHRAFRGKL
jgi:type I restriction enzyme, S subunit